ncbi:MAG: hypothetical protein CMO55_21755 [Verrucomicrobiales bacterium]|nr:hypothetical protein [Verrucomicrobiales bacterium]
MPDKKKHLTRLDRVFPRHPTYFITTTTVDRRKVLDSSAVHEIFTEVWENCVDLYGWSTGPYVIMPDHVHFFVQSGNEDAIELSHFVGKWKEWTSKYLDRRLGIPAPLWQPEFFDHVIRSTESFRKKVEYVWQNPVRAGLVEEPKDWKFRGNASDWIIC